MYSCLMPKQLLDSGPLANKTNEPSIFRRKLSSLVDSYPMLQLMTGDEIFAQRPLIKVI